MSPNVMPVLLTQTDVEQYQVCVKEGFDISEITFMAHFTDYCAQLILLEAQVNDIHAANRTFLNQTLVDKLRRLSEREVDIY